MHLKKGMDTVFKISTLRYTPYMECYAVAQINLWAGYQSPTIVLCCRCACYMGYNMLIIGALECLNYIPCIHFTTLYNKFIITANTGGCLALGSTKCKYWQLHDVILTSILQLTVQKCGTLLQTERCSSLTWTCIQVKDMQKSSSIIWQLVKILTTAQMQIQYVQLS